MINTTCDINIDLSIASPEETIEYFGDDFWKLMNESCGNLDSTIQLVYFLNQLLEENNCQTICDIMCGNCRHILGLNSLGYNVTGVDINEKLLNSIKNSQAYKSNVELICEDIRHWIPINKYDCFTLLTSTIGYFGIEEDKKLLIKLFENLNNGGILVIDLYNYDDVKNNFIKRDWVELEKNIYLFSHKINDDNIKTTNMKVITNSEINNYKMSIQLYSKEDLLNLLFLIGFKNIKVFYDYKKDKGISNLPHRIQIVANK